MRFAVRWAFRLFLVVVVLAVALVLSKNALLQSLSETRLRAQTGMDVRVGKVEVGLFSPTVNVEDFRLFNPAEFGGSPLLDVPNLHVEYDLAALAARKVRFKLVRIAVSELNIVESQDGRTNLVLSLDDLAPHDGGESDRPLSVLGFTIDGVDTLNLTLGRARFTSLRNPGKATEVELGLKNEIFTDIRSVAQLRQVLMKALLRNGITISGPLPPGPGARRGR